MEETRMRAARQAIAICAAMTVAGCSHNFSATGSYDHVVGWSSADKPPPDLAFSNGMPPSSNGPPPEWYAKRFSRARGIGEAIKQNRRSLWDRDSGTFVFYMGSVLSAHYHPWEHYLEIRTEKKDETNTICHWTQNGGLSVSTTDNTPPPADTAATCQQLLDTVANRIAPSGLLSNGS